MLSTALRIIYLTCKHFQQRRRHQGSKALQADADGAAGVPARPPKQQACTTGQDVSLSLEGYTELCRLLVKGTDSVQPVSPLECGLYKVSDIKQVLGDSAC